MKSFLILLASCAFVVSATAQNSTTPTTTKVKRSKASVAPATVPTAATPASTTSPVAQPSRFESRTSLQQAPSVWFRQHASVGLAMSTASDLSGEGASFQMKNSKNIDRGTADLSSSSALSLKGQVINYTQENWGWFGSATLEQSREISSAKLNIGPLKGTLPFNAKPRFMPLIVAGGAAYRFNEKFYALGGLNYTIYDDVGSGDLKSISLDPKLGFQVGVGFRPTSRLTVELTQRDVRYSFSGTDQGDNKVNIDELRLVGLNLGAQYSFQ